jgi:hypothetical protein
MKHFQLVFGSYFYQLPETDEMHNNIEARKNWEPEGPTKVELHIE